MSGVTQCLRALEAMQWHGSVNAIPAWEARGIRHAFLGRGGAEPNEAHHAKQVHGARVIVASERTAPGALAREEADGVYATRPHVNVAVKTADCLPVLLHGPGLVMAVHAGWRGYAAGILGEALRIFADHGVAPGQVTAAVGPALSRDSFEIGPDVAEALRAATRDLGEGHFAVNVMKGEGDRWHYDLPQGAALWLAALGVPAAEINVVRSCTKRHPLAWHSYRLHGKAAGRNWAVISLG